MIEVQGLTKRFDDFTALNEMMLHVPEGRICGLVGQNGAGKTTLIRHIAGVYRPDEGNIYIGGNPVWENPAIKERVVHIPDDLYFIPSVTINDLVHYYKYYYPRFDPDRFENLKQFFPLDLKRRVSKFSKGMQKQTAIWLALCCMPDVMLLDEPIDGLDPVARRAVWQLILQDAVERRTTVLISSHNLRELDGISDYIAIMQDGRLLLERSLKDLQGDVVKLQIIFPNSNGDGDGDSGGQIKTQETNIKIPGFRILQSSKKGHMTEILVKGRAEEALTAAKNMTPAPLLVDIVPLTLEEIFIYELGGMDSAGII